MLASVPFHYVIPGLVFFGVILISLVLVVQFGRKRSPLRDPLGKYREPARVFQIPEDYSALGPDAKRRVTIQNLYLNHGENPEKIAGLLEVETAFVVDVLRSAGHTRPQHRA